MQRRKDRGLLWRASFKCNTIARALREKLGEELPWPPSFAPPALHQLHAMSAPIFAQEVRGMGRGREVGRLLICLFLPGNARASRECAAVIVCRCAGVGRPGQDDAGTKGHE